MTGAVKKVKNPNIEWLRILSMLMVVTLHALGKGGFLQKGAYSGDAVNLVAWIMEACAIAAVNLYVLISGYLLCESSFKFSRLISLVLEVLFYSLGGFFIFKLTGVGGDTDFYSFLSCALPIHMDTYWFMTSYVCLYLFLPLLTIAVKKVTKKQLGLIIAVLLMYECAFKTFLPFSMGIEDHGYSFLWFLILFLIAAYFRKFGFGLLNKPVIGIILYMVGSFLIFLEGFSIDFVATRFGKLELLKLISYDYNHAFVLLAAVGLFSFFMNIKPAKGFLAKVGNFAGKLTLGVYLLHENPVIRYEWVKWFAPDSAGSKGILIFLLNIVAAVIAVFVAGIFIDWLRSMIFAAVAGLKPIEAIKRKLVKMDDAINGTEDI